MFGALVSFLGGSAFRMVWGEISSYFQKKQEHAQEMEMARLQGELEGQRHERDMARIKLQSDLGVKEVQIAGDVAIQAKEADAFVEAIKAAAIPTGVKWVDAWNGVIRPLTASLALALWFWAFIGQGFVLYAWDLELMGTALGFFFADRSLGKRAK